MTLPPPPFGLLQLGCELSSRSVDSLIPAIEFDLPRGKMEKPREKRKSISKVLEGAEQVAHEGDREETGPSPKKKTKKQSSTSSKSPRKAKQKSGDEDHHASAEGRPPWFIFLVCFIFIYFIH
jgi:hypothetical protein